MYRLALQLGIWDVESWLEQISWPQLRMWLAYMEVEPFGEDRADLRAGVIASAIVNSNPYRKGSAKPTDFFRLGEMGDTASERSSNRAFKDPAEWSRMLNSVNSEYSKV